MGVVAGVSAFLLAQGAAAQTIDPYYAVNYTFTDVGSIPGLPSQYGGLTFKYHDSSTILVGGAANTLGGAIYQIAVVRGQGQHITGFTGTATKVIDGAYNDGGVAYGPGNVLFLARWPVNELGQTKFESTITDKIVPLGPLGVVSSPGGLNFIPKGQPNAGKLKMVSWSGGQWYDVVLAPDGTGTYDVTSATYVTTITGGPEGFLYVPPKSPLFVDGSIIVSEYSNGSVGTYETDANGDPILESRKTFMTGLTGAEGAATDPLTGDYLFSTFGGGSRVLVVKGFALRLGAPCVDGADCGSGHCADAVCCDSACTGDACQRCSIAAGAPEDGFCAAVSGIACNDGNGCTGGDTCESGVCVGMVVDCIASDDCHVPTGCDPEDGMCAEAPKQDGAPCAGGVCLAGVCTPDGSGGGGGQGGSGSGGGDGGAGAQNAGSGGNGGGAAAGGGDAGSGGGASSAEPAGCGCRTSERGGAGGAAGLWLLGALLIRRRRTLALAAERRRE